MTKWRGGETIIWKYTDCDGDDGDGNWNEDGDYWGFGYDGDEQAAEHDEFDGTVSYNDDNYDKEDSSEKCGFDGADK